jgi:hypothetical protein
MPNREHIVDTDVPQTALVPDDACIRYRQCGNTIPHNGAMCGECLDELRHTDSNGAVS